MAAEILYEKLGVFYLGKRFDLETGQRLPGAGLYDSKDLVTHAVCVGMTGSGKTGLGISIIEEAAIDGIPVLAIDPKGDLANLLLDAPPEAAGRWRAGLAEWDQDETRTARMRAAADFRVYTPGSRAGIPLALLRSLAPPPGADEETMALRAHAIAASLLSLAGIAESRVHSPEQVLLATLLTHAWGQGGVRSGSQPSGTALDLATLIQQIQRPPFDRVGVLDLETFFPARERQQLALRLNGVLAAPGFDVWLAGEPLDVGALLFTPEGRPRVAIVSIAHLGDAERMMVVSLLLNAVLEWTRRQTGTASLRALVYMDEVFGYLPPSANPPSKLPLLTLLKQARAFGVGVMLSTQNPVDLDYKALSNTGTWFLGKLQTERDKARVLDGLDGAGAGGFDRQQLDRMLSALPERVFLLHDVHEPAPVLFQTRWVLSYLKGPMSLEDIRSLRPPDTNAQGAKPKAQSPTGVAADLQARPVLPAGITEFFLPGDGDVYEPVLYGAARVHYVDAKRGVDVVNDIYAMTPIQSGPVAIDWEQGEMAGVAPSELLAAPPHPHTVAPPRTLAFAPLAPSAASAKSYAAWGSDFERWVARTQPLTLFAAPRLKLSSAPSESEREFQARVQQAAREQRDAAVEKLRARYAPKVARLEEKHRRAAESIAREQQQAGQQKLQTAVSIGATLLGALLGRKTVSASTLGRATTAARGVSRSSKEAEDVARAETRAGDVEMALKALQAEAEAEVAALTAEMSAAPEIQTIEIKPQRGRVDLQLVTLAWRPTTRTPLP